MCLATLLEWGGDLYQRDKSGKSPLDYCSSAFPSTIMDTLKNYLAGSKNILKQLPVFSELFFRVRAYNG